MFDNISKLKAYIYTSIKNGFRNFLDHLKSVNAYEESKKINNEYIDIEIVEVELYSQIYHAINALPETYAAVLRLYIEGYKSNEIAEKLNRTPENVYNIKNKAIKELAKKIPIDKLYTFFPALI